MNKKTKYILSVAGVISAILGITIAIPAFLQNLYTPAIIGTILLVTGLVIIAISFGD